MISKRVLVPLVVLGILFTMGGMAFGQVTNVSCGISAPLGSTTDSPSTGHTEPIAVGSASTGVSPANGVAGGGTIRVTCTNTGLTGTTSDPGVAVLTISLGVPITNSTTHPSATAAIRLVNQTGDFSAANVGLAAVQNSAGQLIVGLGSSPTSSTSSAASPTLGVVFTAATTSSFEIMGVLASVNGRTTPLVASLSSTGGVSISPTASSVTVISTIGPGLKDPTVPTSVPSTVSTTVQGGAAVLNSAGVAVKGNFAIRIEENFADQFRDANQFNGSGVAGNFPQSPSSDVQVQIQLNNIPSGLNISGCSAVTTDTSNAISAGSPTLNFTNLTAASPILTVNFNASLDLANIDVLWILCTTVNAGSATLPLPSTPVTAQVTLAPTGAALSTASGNPPLAGLTTGQVPRYQLSLQPTTPITVVVFPPSNSTLLVSFAAVVPGYETGIAVANTTMDPFGVAGGGAAPSDGTVTFTMYKNDGTSKAYTTTTGSPGSGLTGAGVLKSGGTYSVNLSQLLTASTFGPSFLGYVFITTNFTNAHGSATVYLTSNGDAALSAPVVVLGSISTASTRESPESLGQ